MANGYYERGEIYYIRFDNGFGSEEGAFRPGLIVSSNKGNVKAPVVAVCYLTTQPRDMFIAMETTATGKQSWILANQVATVDKSRLGRLIGVLNASEMREFDARLEEVFDLGYIDDVALKEKDKEIEAIRAEKEELLAEIIELKNKIAAQAEAHEDEMATLRIENTMWQRLYDKALGQVVDMKFATDVSLRQERKPVVVEEPKKEEVKPVKVSIELNTCTETDLRQCGCTEAQARLIKAHGVYSSVEDLLDVPGVTRALFDTLKDRVHCDSNNDGNKVDINHCTQTALKKMGFSLAMARAIVKGRPYASVLDLKRVPGLSARMYRIAEPKVCCTPIAEEPKKVVSALPEPDPGYEVEEPVQETDVPRKANINTMGGKELHEILGISIATCYSISGYRRKHGLYKNLEELLNVKGIFPVTIDRLRDKLEV